MNSTESLEARLQQIEALLSHLQHDLDKLNEVMAVHQGRLQQLSAEYERMQAALEEPLPLPDPEQDRPPHY